MLFLHSCSYRENPGRAATAAAARGRISNQVVQHHLSRRRGYRGDVGGDASAAISYRGLQFNRSGLAHVGPSTRPARAAPREARVLSPYRRHRIVCSTRPPSKGDPGSRLNSASSRLTPDSHHATPTASGAAATPRKLAAIPAKMADSRRLVSGPENAIQDWVRGVLASPSTRVTPPNIHSVTEDTSMPARRATNAWVASCASSDISSTTAPMTPATQ